MLEAVVVVSVLDRVVEVEVVLVAEEYEVVKLKENEVIELEKDDVVLIVELRGLFSIASLAAAIVSSAHLQRPQRSKMNI